VARGHGVHRDIITTIIFGSKKRAEKGKKLVPYEGRALQELTKVNPVVAEYDCEE
jgi:hypothetical protein